MDIINDFCWCLQNHTIAVIVLAMCCDNVYEFAIWMLLCMYVFFPG